MENIGNIMAAKKKKVVKKKVVKKAVVKRKTGGRKTAKKKSYRRSKFTNVGLVPLGVGINALNQMGIIDGAQQAMVGDLAGATETIRSNAGNVTNWAASIVPAVIAGAARKFLGKVPLIKVGNIKINMF